MRPTRDSVGSKLLVRFAQSLVRVRHTSPRSTAAEAVFYEKKDVDEIVFVGGSTPASRGINPDEVVAYDVAVKVGIPQWRIGNRSLLDVKLLTMGIETIREVISKLIPRNTVITTKNLLYLRYQYAVAIPGLQR